MALDKASGRGDNNGVWSSAFLLASLLAVLTLILGDLSFTSRWGEFLWTRDTAAIVWLAAAALWFLLPGGGRRRRELACGRGRWLPLVPAAGLVLVMASSVRKGDWYFFLDPWAVVKLVALLLPAAAGLELVERRKWDRFVFPALLALAQAWLLWHLYRTTGGQPIYRDDHSSFLYRYWLLPRALPHLFFYNPFWNGGYAGAELITTGAMSVGLLFLPFQLLFGLEKSYVPFLGGLFFVALPWAVYFSVRRLGWSRLAALVAAVLAIGANRFYFINLLVYGTTPSLLTFYLMLLTWALLYAVFNLGRTGFWAWAALVACVNLMLFWPASPLVLVPVGLGALAGLPRLGRRTVLFLGSAVLVLALVNAGWIVEYLSHPKVVNFITKGAVRSPDVDWPRALRSLGNSLAQIHPLALALGFLGLMWPGRREETAWLAPPVAAFMLMVSLGPQLAPDLQLHRMITPLSLLLLMPAASVISRAASGRDLPRAVFRGTLGAAVLLTVLNVGGILQNRGKELIVTAPGDLRAIVAWIKKNVPEDGRVFFAGYTVHGYGGGHVAYLQAATGRNMIAGDFYHFNIRQWDWNPMPVQFRGSRKKVREYFRLMGVTHILTYDRGWQESLRKKKDYRLLETFGRREAWATGIEPGLLLKGKGRVEPAVNRLRVKLDGPEDEVILKFLWLPGLTADPPVAVRPVEAAPGLTFIAARPGGRREFTIRYDP